MPLLLRSALCQSFIVISQSRMSTVGGSNENMNAAAQSVPELPYSKQGGVVEKGLGRSKREGNGGPAMD